MKSKDTRRMIKVPAGTYQELKAKADQLGLTVPAALKLLVKSWLDVHESDAKMRIPPTL